MPKFLCLLLAQKVLLAMDLKDPLLAPAELDLLTFEEVEEF